MIVFDGKPYFLNTREGYIIAESRFSVWSHWIRFSPVNWSPQPLMKQSCGGLILIITIWLMVQASFWLALHINFLYVHIFICTFLIIYISPHAPWLTGNVLAYYSFGSCWNLLDFTFFFLVFLLGFPA